MSGCSIYVGAVKLYVNNCNEKSYVRAANMALRSSAAISPEQFRRLILGIKLGIASFRSRNLGHSQIRGISARRAVMDGGCSNVFQNLAP